MAYPRGWSKIKLLLLPLALILAAVFAYWRLYSPQTRFLPLPARPSHQSSIPFLTANLSSIENATHCGDEKMAYTHSVHLHLLYPTLFTEIHRAGYSSPNELASPALMHGRRFSCSELTTLHQLHLSNEYRIVTKLVNRGNDTGRNGLSINPSNSSLPTRFVFVTVADKNFYSYTRTAIATIQKYLPLSSYRILLYNLDGDNLTTQGDWLAELSQICHLEVRPYDLNKRLPKEVAYKHSFAWKPLIIAEVFKELDPDNELLVYCDSSLRFKNESAAQFFRLLHAQMGDFGSRLTPLQMPGSDSGHSMRFAIHAEMYTWLPLDPRLLREVMREANFMLVRRCETARLLLKWAVLCARRKACIDPDGSQLICPWESDADPAKCHRQDQAAFNILLGNLEVDWWAATAASRKGGDIGLQSATLPFNPANNTYHSSYRYTWSLHRRDAGKESVNLANCKKEGEG